MDTAATAFSVIELSKGSEQGVQRKVMSDSVKSAMAATLRHFTVDSWQADQWDVYVPSSQRRKVLRFPSTNVYDSDILRTAALLLLVETGSVDAAQRVIREGRLFMDFLAMNKVTIENTRTHLVEAYIRKMEDDNVSEGVIASRVRSARALFDTCIENDLVDSTCKVIFQYQRKTPVAPRRPPDSCVIDEIDRLVLNLPDCEVPLTIRTLYLLARMIPCRISELLAMNTDCIKYIGKDLFSVSKPTSKETSQHIPVYKPYVFSLEGKTEEMLHRCLCELISFNRSENALNADTDFLFYDSRLHRVLRDSDFNEFLAKLVADHKIRNEDGSSPKVTSHTFRHVTIGERLRSGIYTVEDTAEEACHSDPNVTLGYGHSSQNDETKRLGKIAEEIINKEFGSQTNGEIKKRTMTSAKFTRLLKNTPLLRLIPIVGACDNSSCNPQYVECINCDSFEPDRIYLEYFVEVRKLILDRLERLRKGGAEEAILFEEYELEIVEKYIAKMDQNSSREQKNMTGRDIIIVTEENLVAV